MEVAEVCLRDQDIDDDDNSVVRVRWARELSDDDGGVGGGEEE